jgi:hypothetical protein
MFFARAWPRWKIVYKTMATTKIFLRPISSLPGPQIIGYEGPWIRITLVEREVVSLTPKQYPIRKTVVIKFDTSLEIWNSAWTLRDTDDGADEAKVL